MTPEPQASGPDTPYGLVALRRRLGQLLGRDALADLDHAAADVGAVSGRLAELEQALLQAGEDLAQRSEELDAARQINRELIAKLNRQRP